MISAAPNIERAASRDGTLCEMKVRAAFHRAAWSALAQKIGAVLPESVFQSIHGLRSEDVIPRLLGRDLGPSLLGALVREKEDRYRELCRSRVDAVAGAGDLLARLRGAGVKIALATSAEPESRAMILDALGWSASFDAVVEPGEHAGNPAADLFLATASALGVAPAGCLVFEATWNGVRAAAAAGMSVIGVTSSAEAEVLLRAGAGRTIATYTVLPEDLDALMP
jgi:HAD superfamily hydrolase (TIGR01509 family)